MIVLFISWGFKSGCAFAVFQDEPEASQVIADLPCLISVKATLLNENVRLLRDMVGAWL